ncbi:hypothetical protein COO59_13475 [Mixta theicola]|uniref:Uncharacterized protein n=1 Tax=Mixta theicola TaxID=1458355 RepID=A0A2K1Q8A8_9GAMM|nr:hypothetical protein [Mixta theicola]PNS11270.1 hypothetical protein COO59_13475 [Mixta theicola]GLR07456.1 hypothetical protein GCM10007905_01750 [Mixta theicola]
MAAAANPVQIMEASVPGNRQKKEPKKQANLMKIIIHFLLYLVLFIIGFALLNNANVLDLNTTSRSETISKFIVMIIVLIATMRWGIKSYKLLVGRKKIVKKRKASFPFS